MLREKIPHLHTGTVAETLNDDLFNAVSTVIDEHGWPGVTAELIARAAGINRTTLYRNGYTRERLLTEAAARIASEFRVATLGPLTGPGTARDRMLKLLDTLYDLADQHLGLMAGLYDGPTAIFHLHLDDSAILTRFEYTDPFARLLTDGNTDGTLTSADPNVDAELIFNTAGWTYIHFRRSHGWPAGKARPAVTRITLGAFEPAQSD